MKFELAMRCLVGSAGQDLIFARVFESEAVFALADGAGGRAGGEEAAQIVVHEAAKVAQSVENPRDANFWAAWLGEVDERVERDSNAGETTAIVAALGPDFVAGASAGDSSAWLIGAENWIDLTARQIGKPFLGQGAMAVPFSARVSGQTLLVASDGLTKYADAEVLVNLVRGADLEVAADRSLKRFATHQALCPTIFRAFCAVTREQKKENLRRRSQIFGLGFQDKRRVEGCKCRAMTCHCRWTIWLVSNHSCDAG